MSGLARRRCLLSIAWCGSIECRQVRSTHLLTTQVLWWPQYTTRAAFSLPQRLLERVRVFRVESARSAAAPAHGADEVRFTIDGKSQPATGVSQKA